MARVDTELLRSNARMAQTIGYGAWLAASKPRANQNLSPAVLLERWAARQLTDSVLRRAFDERSRSAAGLTSRD